MVEHQFRIADIEVAKSPTDEKIVGLFRFEGTGQQKRGTTLVILAEIFSTLYAYERLLDIINETAEQAKHLVAGVEQDPVSRFEKLIQRLNEAVATFLEGEPTPLAWNRVNIFIIELSQDHICLTGVGRLMNIFLQKQEDGSFKMFDLFGSLEQAADVDPKKVFSSLICGDVKPGDVLMAGTLNLERLRNELRVRERLTTLPPVSAALEMKRDLEHRGIPDDFVAAVIACCALEMPDVIPAASVVVEAADKSTASINKLRNTEKEAHQHLSPTITPPKPAPGSSPAMNPILSKVQGALTLVRHKLAQFRKKDVATMTSFRGMSAGHGSAFTSKHKRIAVISAAVLLLLVGGFLWIRHTQRVAADNAVWQAALASAQDNKNRADSDLVYGNDERATNEIHTAEQIVSKLDVSTTARKSAVDGLTNDIAGLKEKLRKATPVTPTVLAQGTGTLAAPVLVHGVAYAVDNAAHLILKVDLNGNLVKRIKIPSSTEPIVAGSLGKQSVVFMTASGRLHAIDTKTDAVVTLSSGVHASGTTDIILYANRAYVLDGSSGQIYRANSQAGGFGPGSAYIKATGSPLDGAVSLAVDSNVYVLKPDGTLVRFLSGGQEGFALSPIDPPLRAASAVWTNADATRIAVTDPMSKRIVLYTKDGKLTAQLTSPQFTEPRDIDGDEANKRLLVTDGSSLLLVPMP